MSNDMPQTSWRALASAASRHIKGYVSPRDAHQGYPASRTARVLGEDKYSKVQAWGQWAGRMLKRGMSDPNSMEKLNLFPGWAARKYHDPSTPQQENEPKPFDIDVFVSGYAYKSSPLGFNTRTGRTFIRVARNYAALPKLAATDVAQAFSDHGDSYRSYDDSRDDFGFAPDQADEDAMLEVMQAEVRQHELQVNRDPNGDASSISSSPGSRSPMFNSKPLPNGSTALLCSSSSPPSSPSLAQALHSNLESRLANFWNTALSSRQVRISLYAMDPTSFDPYDAPNSRSSDEIMEQRPLWQRDVSTQDAGYFQAKLHIPWERMCMHPGALQLAFGDPLTENELFVVVELLPPAPSPSGTTVQPPDLMPYPSASTSINIPLTYSPVRVISDIDDTVKLSNILGGTRAVFHQVFARDLRDSVIPEMADWYNDMWRRGLRFHYVSNAPLQMLPVILEFLRLAKLPPGSVKLRSYAGRLLIRDMLTAAAERKRAGLMDILDNFPGARFILVGDSGEQDLELYASVAKLRPEQILAIFIREAMLFDSDASGGPQPLEDPTGEAILRGSTDTGSEPSSPVSSARPLSRRSSLKASLPRTIRSKSEMGSPRLIPRKPSRTFTFTGEPLSAPARNETANGYFSPAFARASPISEEPPPLDSPTPKTSPDPQRMATAGAQEPPPPPMSPAERRRYELQMRVWKARLDVPSHIPLRVFRKPEECVEARDVVEFAFVQP